MVLNYVLKKMKIEKYITNIDRGGNFTIVKRCSTIDFIDIIMFCDDFKFIYRKINSNLYGFGLYLNNKKYGIYRI